MNILEITGKTKDHLIFDNDLQRYFHKETHQKFLDLKKVALDYDIDLYILSSFSSFEDQLTIWNKKCLGQKTLFDSNGTPLNYHTLSPKENKVGKYS